MNYKQLQRTVQRLISKYDQRGHILMTTRATGSIDPLTGLYVDGVTTTRTVTAVTTNYDDNQIDGEMIQVGDMHMLLTSDNQPHVGDYVYIDGAEYTVVEPITQHNPGGIILMWECNLRR